MNTDQEGAGIFLGSNNDRRITLIPKKRHRIEIQVRPNLMKLFHKRPHIPVQIRLTPHEQRDTQSGAYYVAGSPDCDDRP